MKYVDAINLINEAIKLNILKSKENKVFVYCDSNDFMDAGWYLADLDLVAKDLVNDVGGQKALKAAVEAKKQYK